MFIPQFGAGSGWQMSYRLPSCTGSSRSSWGGMTIICTAFASMAETTALPISADRTSVRTPLPCLDWFHVAMRLTVLGQMIKSARTEATTAEAKAAALERIKWLLWHGNAPDALDDIECLVDDVTAELEDNPTSSSLRKLAAALGEFATYIANNAGHIVNYGERFRAGERISTGFVESAINQIVDKRFDKRQSMRWTPRGAHLLLQTRTRVLNNDLDQVIRRCYPAFRRSQATDIAPVL